MHFATRSEGLAGNEPGVDPAQAPAADARDAHRRAKFILLTRKTRRGQPAGFQFNSYRGVSFGARDPSRCTDAGLTKSDATAAGRGRAADAKAGISADCLIEAIDDYVENLTGDRRALHAKHQSMDDRIEYAEARSYAAPETAARRITEIANTIEADQGMVHIEKINYPMLFQDKASPAEYWAGLQCWQGIDASV